MSEHFFIINDFCFTNEFYKKLSNETLHLHQKGLVWMLIEPRPMIICLKYKSLFLLRFPTVTVMEGTSSIVKHSEEEEYRANYHPFQWIQQEKNSPIIKLEPETTNESPPGKSHVDMCFCKFTYNVVDIRDL